MWLEDFWPVVDGDEEGRPARERLVTRRGSEINMGFAWVPIDRGVRGHAHRDLVTRWADDRDGHPAAVPRPEEGIVPKQ